MTFTTHLKSLFWFGAAAFVLVGCSSGPEIADQTPQFQVPGNQPISNAPGNSSGGNNNTSAPIGGSGGNEDVEDEGNGEEQASNLDPELKETLKGLESLLGQTNKNAKDAKDNSDKARKSAGLNNWITGGGLLALGGGLVWHDQRNRKLNNENKDEVIGQMTAYEGNAQKRHGQNSARLADISDDVIMNQAISADTLETTRETQSEVRGVRDQVANMELTLDLMEGDILAMREQALPEIQKGVAQLEQRVETLSTDTGNAFGALESNLVSYMKRDAEDLASRLAEERGKLESSMLALSEMNTIEADGRHDEVIAALNSDRAEKITAIEQHTAQIAALEDRLKSVQEALASKTKADEKDSPAQEKEPTSESERVAAANMSEAVADFLVSERGRALAKRLGIQDDRVEIFEQRMRENAEKIRNGKEEQI